MGKSPAKAAKHLEDAVKLRPNGKSIQLRFQHRGQRVPISNGWKWDNPVHQQQARKVQAEIADAMLKETVDEWLEQWHSRNLPAAPTAESTPALSKIYSQYREYRYGEAKEISKSTYYRDYKKVLDRLENLPPHINNAGAKSEDGARAVAEALESYLNLGQEVRRRTLVALNAACRWAADERPPPLLSSNPFKAIKPPKKVKRTSTDEYKAFTDKEMDVILTALNAAADGYFGDAYSKVAPEYRTYIILLYKFGCRPGELSALRWGDVTKDGKKVRFHRSRPSDVGIEGPTKTKKERTFPCGPELAAFLVRLRKEAEAQGRGSADDLVCPSPRGIHIDSHNVLNRVWKPWIESLHKGGAVFQKLSLYNLRHTRIDQFKRAGISNATIGAWVGNSPWVIENNYASPQRGQVAPD
jgi:integrase